MSEFEQLAIRSPKRTRRDTTAQWYSYYAGYSPGFVSDVFDAFGQDAESAVDPWNGAGTTTLLASKRGMRSLGRDINPALTVVAKGRQTPRSISDSLLPIAKRLCKDAEERMDHSFLNEDDLLRVWLQPNSAAWVRGLVSAVHETLTADAGPGAWEEAGDLPVLAAFFYTAAFATVRDTLEGFRASNPTWLKEPESHRHRIRPSVETLTGRFIEQCQRLRSWLTLETDAQAESASFRAESATTPPSNREAKYDIAITSPPYCTRIDYVKSSLAELAVLGLKRSDVDDLRLRTTGSPVVGSGRLAAERLTDRSPTAARDLLVVGQHASKGSKSYYLPWLSRYFVELDKSIEVLVSMMTPGGKICMVVQDSFYKEHHVDLQTVTTELANSSGAELTHRQDFEVTQIRASMNPAARVHRQERAATESLLVFET